MEYLRRKNSIWQLYGLVIITIGIYVFFILIGNTIFTIMGVIILLLFSLLIIFSQWPCNVEVVFSNEFMVVKHKITLQSRKYLYSDIKSVDYIYMKVMGSRLIFKCIDAENKSTQFAMYNLDQELIEFVKDNIATFKNKIDLWYF